MWKGEERSLARRNRCHGVFPLLFREAVGGTAAMHSRVLTACRGEKFSAAALNRESRVPRISSLPRPTLAKFRLKRFHIDPSSTRTRDSTDSIQFRGIIRAAIIGDLHTLREGNVRNSLETGFEFEFSEKFRSKFSSEFENFFF